jgi:hypothetical protein
VCRNIYMCKIALLYTACEDGNIDPSYLTEVIILQPIIWNIFGEL